MSPAEFHQVELMNRTLRRIAEALETIAKAVPPEDDESTDEQ